MFESLSERLSGILDKITGRGALSESDVEEALREVRRALLEAGDGENGSCSANTLDASSFARAIASLSVFP